MSEVQECAQRNTFRTVTTLPKLQSPISLCSRCAEISSEWLDEHSPRLVDIARARSKRRARAPQRLRATAMAASCCGRGSSPRPCSCSPSSTFRGRARRPRWRPRSSSNSSATTARRRGCLRDGQKLPDPGGTQRGRLGSRPDVESPGGDGAARGWRSGPGGRRIIMGSSCREVCALQWE